MENKTILSIKDLSVHYVTREMGTCRAVNNFSLDIRQGETIGLVGETGAGKTTIALSVMGLLQTPPGKVVSGSIEYNGEDLLKKSAKQMRKIRGAEISMIFQDPMTALNPIDTVGKQIAEVIRLHQPVNDVQAAEKAGDMMELIGIPRTRYNDYPHQFSGGMKQRIVIAMALACSPRLLLADEPTTALDVTIQAQVLEKINELKKMLNTSVLLITHDLGIVAGMCDRVAVMYAGEIVEYGTTREIFKHAMHPYTKGLFNSLPSQDTERLKPIKGLMPDPSNLPERCKFEPRCEACAEKCKHTTPTLVQINENHWVCCNYAQEG